MCKALLPLKLLVDATDCPFIWQNETYILYFLPLLPSCSENVPAPLQQIQKKSEAYTIAIKRG